MSYAAHDHQLQAYYSRRATTYDQGGEFDAPKCGALLRELAPVVQSALIGRRVLEIACGTGIWTKVAADVAQHIVATDVADATLEQARHKQLAPDKVEFRLADAYALDDLTGEFDAGLAVQWFSHMPKHRYDEFFAAWHRRLGPNAVVLIADTQPDEKLMHKAFSKPGEPDAYQKRRTIDGGEFEIIKNYFIAAELRDIFGPRSKDLTLHWGEHGWWAQYFVPSRSIR